ncbi:MAG: tetratricopeptide repeat protein [Marinicella sp.]
MIWQNPRKFIKKILFSTGIISLILAVAFISLAILWENKELIKSYDKTRENNYNKKLRRIQKAIGDDTSEIDKFEKYQTLRREIAQTNRLHLFQDLHHETYDYLINYHINMGQLEDAQELTEEWMTNQPNNLLAKYAHADISYKINQEDGLSFIQQVADKYYDIAAVQKKAIRLYLQSHQTEKALELVDKFKPYRRTTHRTSFMYYYSDTDKPKFSQKSIIRLLMGDYKQSNSKVSISVQYQFNGLKKLRFDVDQVPPGTVLFNTEFNIVHNDETYPLDWQPLNSITRIDDNLVVTGKDPYMLFDLPETIIGITDPVNLTASFKIIYKNSDPMDAFFIDSQNWKLTESEQNIQWNLFGQMGYFSELPSSTRYKLDINNLQGLNFESIYIQSNDGKKIIPTKLEGIQSTEVGHLITSNKASVIFEDVIQNSELKLFLIQEADNK